MVFPPLPANRFLHWQLLSPLTSPPVVHRRAAGPAWRDSRYPNTRINQGHRNETHHASLPYPRTRRHQRQPSARRAPAARRAASPDSACDGRCGAGHAALVGVRQGQPICRHLRRESRPQRGTSPLSRARRADSWTTRRWRCNPRRPDHHLLRLPTRDLARVTTLRPAGAKRQHERTREGTGGASNPVTTLGYAIWTSSLPLVS